MASEHEYYSFYFEKNLMWYNMISIIILNKPYPNFYPQNTIHGKRLGALALANQTTKWDGFKLMRLPGTDSHRTKSIKFLLEWKKTIIHHELMFAELGRLFRIKAWNLHYTHELYIKFGLTKRYKEIFSYLEQAFETKVTKRVLLLTKKKFELTLEHKHSCQKSKCWEEIRLRIKYKERKRNQYFYFYFIQWLLVLAFLIFLFMPAVEINYIHNNSMIMLFRAKRWPADNFYSTPRRSTSLDVINKFQANSTE